MIIGLGIDVEEVERVKGAMERQGERFLKRIFTENSARTANTQIKVRRAFAVKSGYEMGTG
jgi:phosphopantetheinyl transferase (holo-ACP synthase)